MGAAAEEQNLLSLLVTEVMINNTGMESIMFVSHVKITFMPIKQMMHVSKTKTRAIRQHRSLELVVSV